MIDKLVKRLQDINEKENGHYKYIKWFNQVKQKDVSLVGKKAYHLAVLYRKKFLVPNAFVLLPNAFEYTLKQNNIYHPLIESLKKLKEMSSEKRENFIEDTANRIQKAIVYSTIPNSIRVEVDSNFRILNLNKNVGTTDLLDQKKENKFASVRISTDVQIVKPFHLSFLNVARSDLFDAIKTIWAAMFLSENIKKFINDYEKLFNVPILVQEMIYASRSGRAIVEGKTASILASKGFGIIFRDHLDCDSYNVDLGSYKIDVNTKLKEYYYTIVDDKIEKVDSNIEDQTYNDHEIRDIAYMIKRVCLDMGKDGVVDFSSVDDKIYILQYSEGKGEFTESMFESEKASDDLELDIDDSFHVNKPAPLVSSQPKIPQSNTENLDVSSESVLAVSKEQKSEQNLQKNEPEQVSSERKTDSYTSGNPLFDFLSGKSSSIESPKRNIDLMKEHQSEPVSETVVSIPEKSVNEPKKVDGGTYNSSKEEVKKAPSLISSLLKSEAETNVSSEENKKDYYDHDAEDIVVEDMDKDYIYKLYDEYLDSKNEDRKSTEKTDTSSEDISPDVKLKRILLQLYSKNQNKIDLSDIKETVENINQKETSEILSAIEKIINRV